MAQKKDSQEFIRIATSLLILSVLARHSRLHGYAITQEIELLSGKKFQLGQASLYPVLNSLLEKGFVEYELEAPTRGPSRKAYKLTESGKFEYARQREAFNSYISLANSIMDGKPVSV